MLLETAGNSFRFRITPEALAGKHTSLGELFKLLQENQTDQELADFQLSQTSLEQIFNRFALTQGMDSGEAANASATPSAASAPDSGAMQVANASSGEAASAEAAVIGKKEENEPASSDNPGSTKEPEKATEYVEDVGEEAHVKLQTGS